MSDTPPVDPPSPFIARWIGDLARSSHRGRAFDVATGRGRHAELLARAGYRVFAVDWKIDAAISARRRASLPGGSHPLVWVADLTLHPLPRSFFDLIVVTRYLQRDLFGALADSLVHGGVMLYETFTEGQRTLGWGPTSPDHLLAPGELRMLAGGLDVLFYEEVSEPESVARLAVRRV